MNKYFKKIYQYFEELSSKFDVSDAINLLYYFAIMILIGTIVISIIIMIFRYFKYKNFDIRYVYAILISISIYSFVSLLYYIMLNKFNLSIIVKYFIGLMSPIIVLIIIYIIMLFISHREKPKKINYLEFKRNLLVKCDNCKREYRKKDIAINEEDYHLCKICQKERENSK